MTTFVIRNEDEEDLGFILFAKHSGEWPPPGSIDCVFMDAPRGAALLHDPGVRLIAEHKGREWTAEVIYTSTHMIVRIDLSTDWRFEVISDEISTRWQARQRNEHLQGLGMLL